VTKLRRILVGIRDVERPALSRSALRKAGALARTAGASVELFHALAAQDLAVVSRETCAAAAATARQRLERLARGGAFRGISVRCTTAWDHPTHEAIVRRALASRADLVIAAMHAHRPGARLLLRNTDWELIRHCPAPLLLVKSRREYRRPVILAAVDPFHAHSKPAGLDTRLLAAGRRLAGLLRGTLHLFHAYLPQVSVAPAAAATAPLGLLPPEAEEAHGQQVARVVARLGASAGIPRSRRHVHMGYVAGELRAACRQTRAAVTVMGAVSRSAVARPLIGSTAARVLDKLGCDVLVVKPRGFKTRVRRRRSAPRYLPRRGAVLSAAAR
jgi:universal stress protein E